MKIKNCKMITNIAAASDVRVFWNRRRTLTNIAAVRHLVENHFSNNLKKNNAKNVYMSTLWWTTYYGANAHKKRVRKFNVKKYNFLQQITLTSSCGPNTESRLNLGNENGILM